MSASRSDVPKYSERIRMRALGGAGVAGGAGGLVATAGDGRGLLTGASVRGGSTCCVVDALRITKGASVAGSGCTCTGDVVEPRGHSQ